MSGANGIIILAAAFSSSSGEDRAKRVAWLCTHFQVIRPCSHLSALILRTSESTYVVDIKDHAMCQEH